MILHLSSLKFSSLSPVYLHIIYEQFSSILQAINLYFHVLDVYIYKKKELISGCCPVGHCSISPDLWSHFPVTKVWVSRYNGLSTFMSLLMAMVAVSGRL